MIDWKKVSMILCVALLPMALLAQPSGAKREMDPEKASAKMTQKLTERLQLSEEQQVQVQAILKESMDRRKQVHESGTSREEAKPQMEQIREETNAQMKDVLTAEQFEEYQKIQREMHQRMRERKQQRQGAR